MKEAGKGLLDDLFNLGGQAADIGNNFKHETKDYIKGKVESLLSDMDLITREEMNAWQERFSQLEQENDTLKKRLAKLEKNTNTSPKTKTKTTKGASA